MNKNNVVEQIIDNKVVIDLKSLKGDNLSENITCNLSIKDLLKLGDKVTKEALKDLNNLQESLNKKGAFNLEISFDCSCESNLITSHINSFDMLIENKIVTYTNELQTDNYFITQQETISHIQGL